MISKEQYVTIHTPRTNIWDTTQGGLHLCPKMRLVFGKIPEDVKLETLLLWMEEIIKIVRITCQGLPTLFAESLCPDVVSVDPDSEL